MRIWPKLKALLSREQLEADMTEELRAHLEMQEAANRAAGMSAEEARYAARRQFGGVDQIKEQARDQRGLHRPRHVLRRQRAVVAPPLGRRAQPQPARQVPRQVLPRPRSSTTLSGSWPGCRRAGDYPPSWWRSIR